MPLTPTASSTTRIPPPPGANKPLVGAGTLGTAKQVLSAASSLTAKDINSALELFWTKIHARFEQFSKLTERNFDLTKNQIYELTSVIAEKFKEITTPHESLEEFFHQQETITDQLHTLYTLVSNSKTQNEQLTALTTGIQTLKDTIETLTTNQQQQQDNYNTLLQMITAEKSPTLFQYADSLISSGLKFIGTGALGAAFMHYWNNPVSTQHPTNTATLTNNTITEEANNLYSDVTSKNETSLNAQASNLTNNTFENLLAPSNSSLIPNTTNPTTLTSSLDLSQCPANAYSNTTTHPEFSDSLTKLSSSRFDLPQCPASASGNTTTYPGFSDSLPKPFSKTNTSNLIMDDQPAFAKPFSSMFDLSQCPANAYGNTTTYPGFSDLLSNSSIPLVDTTDNITASSSLFDQLQNPLDGNLTTLALLTTVVALGYFARKTISSYFTSIHQAVTTQQKKQSFSIIRDWRALLGE